MIVVAVVVVIVAIVGAITVTGLASSGAQTLGPTTAAPVGSKALVEVLRREGVTVKVTSTLRQTSRAAAAADGRVTVFAYDPQAILDRSQWASLGSLGDHTVVADAGQDALAALAPGVHEAQDALSSTLTPSCDLPALAKVRTVTGGGYGFTVAPTAADDAGTTSCLPSASGAETSYGLVQVERDGHTTTALGASSALENGVITDHDDAALALTLLGDSPTLIWYLPTLADLPKSGGGTLQSLTPGWVTPAIALLGVAAIVAAFWRGRRLGPLVVENLPVIVRSTETVEGRARLYQRGSSRGHALDQLRIGAIGRLASATGLGSRASVDDVVLRVAALLGVDPRRVHSTLVGVSPGDDRQLVAMSDDLADLEAAALRATRPARPGRPHDPDASPSKGTA
ncbi:hypothetical protein C8E83_0360 [Frondihabitans australicus]|uniref:DUF4350 domain-containing protein n=1 Tax=Frondihabitans australicus TaxID=386892 RepID=A0A495IC97_9MICO|nr:hypothetical protein C8E83_0360 [Frondihabitans australicus]